MDSAVPELLSSVHASLPVRCRADRAAPLIYGEAGGSYVVIASKAGMPTHPLWYLNLEANPGCKLMVGPKAVSARARVAEGAERERLWQQMAKLYPPYDQYQERAGGRTIPVVVLDPVD
jgi:deazaflavin-dependent oxidoreductase (nitroreductase family)